MPAFAARHFLVGWHAQRELVAEVCAAARSVAGRVLADRMRQVLTVDVRDRLAAIAVPVLYLRGRADRLVGGRGLAQCKGRVARLVVAEIDGPHLLLHARPRECADAILRFLA